MPDETKKVERNLNALCTRAREEIFLLQESLYVRRVPATLIRTTGMIIMVRNDAQ